MAGRQGVESFTNGTATGWFVVIKLQNFQYCRNRGEAAALSGSRGPISCLKLHERSPSLCPGGSREPILCLKLHEVGIICKQRLLPRCIRSTMSRPETFCFTPPETHQGARYGPDSSSSSKYLRSFGRRPS